MKVLVFDMDGTIADFYHVPTWQTDLTECNPRPYATAQPLYDMDALNIALNALKAHGWKVVVTSWMSKVCNTDFAKAIRTAKTEWLNRFDFPYDELHIVKYGTTKADCTRQYGQEQILFDDNEKVRAGWHLGRTIDASTANILEVLLNLLESEEQ